ncbi:pentapeptide repeat-containing protein [Crocosphaera sp. Alani8]|uniref:pentapeptide repeat-containing protein n=1 Tax=Crocosphaera sp. Alani8 TaxID=3038952 RepID=UPI00313B011B
MSGDKSVDHHPSPINVNKPLQVSLKSLRYEINFHNFELIVSFFRKVSEDNLIQVDYIDQSSFNLILNGSEQGLRKLEKLFRAGTLEKSIKKIKSEYFSQIIIENLCFVEDVEVIKKCQIIQETRVQGIDKNKLIKEYLSGVDLSGANLQGINLSWSNLSNINLQGANLTGANLSGVNLNQSNLIESYLTEVSLVGADLIEANLMGAELTKSVLIGTDLSHADLSGCNLSKANLSDCNLSYTNLSWANMSSTNLSNCKFNNAILQRSHLDKANLTNVNFNDVDVTNAKFADNKGISDEQKNTLIQRGASFHSP